MVFDSRIISQRQAVRLLAQFEHVLAQLWNDNSISIDQVDFLSPADKDEISSHLNDPPPTSSATLCLHDIIESHALSRPDSLAVASWDGDLTYSDLNSLADKLATQLARLADVGPGATVPLCFEKSKWTQVAMLGVLKAGAAFVLLDPANPVSRLESICRRVNATVAVVSKSFSHALTPLVQTNIVLDDSLRDSPLEPPLSVSTSPDSAAYVITTSGTTGEPKACVIEHRSIVAEAMAFATVAHVDANTRAMQFASYNFDACLIETIMIWAAGGCTCVLSETDRKDNLAGAINKLKINWALMTPSLAGLLEPELVPTLRTVVLGGEAATLELRTIWADAVTLLQAYGPCECCPVACCSPQPMDSSSNPRNIGKPLPGVHAWVIDPKDQNRLAPAGSVGELLLEGPTVGRGYVNEPAKTAAAFINPPSWRERFPGQPQRFYRTGDLVRLDYAGTLEFIGRKDSQVKIRGIRLELAEIEHHLKRLMSIPSDIAVELCCNQDRKISRGRLTAFITLGKAFDSSEDIVARALDEALGDVRTKLTDFLPSYMIPSTFVPLRTLPLNPSGKIDRKALRELGSRIQSDHIEHRGNQPSTSTEQILQSLWARVLNIEVGKIHTEASFLELGGDSLAAMRLASKAREAGISLGVADILRQPRFADMESAV
ncbi:acetyl-CoA synthetase-like protein, partial [Saccharata proteae CBS 121410]